MNKVILCGRLTADPITRYTQGENPMAIANYTLAVNRRPTKDGKQEADFIRCVAMGGSGQFAEKYLRKGMKILVSGRIQTGAYEKDGTKHYTTDILVDEHEFCESKGDTNKESTSDFMNIPDNISEELPFN